MLLKKVIAINTLLMATNVIAVLENVVEALAALKNAPYGFCCVDVGITEADNAYFDALSITKTVWLDHCSADTISTSEIEQFLCTMGNNDTELIKHVTHRISTIIDIVMHASGREAAWISLRATTPTNAYDTPRWHMDSYYFTPAYPEELLYKCAITLVGASTLFYPVTHEERRAVWYKTPDTEYMRTFCKQEQIITPKPGEGVLFIGGRPHQSALHSEPPIHEPRLFLSIVPCNAQQIHELKTKIRHQNV